MRSLGYGDVMWLARRVGAALLVAIAGLAAYAGWLYARGHAADERRRLERLQTLAGEQQRLREGLGAVDRRLAGLQTDLAAQEERRQLAGQAAATLRAGDTWWRAAWEKLFGDAAAARTREDVLDQLDRARAEAGARGADLRTAITRATWERDGLEIELGRVERRLAAAEADRPGAAYYLGRAWRNARWYVVPGLAAWLLMLTVWSLTRK